MCFYLQYFGQDKFVQHSRKLWLCERLEHINVWLMIYMIRNPDHPLFTVQKSHYIPFIQQIQPHCLVSAGWGIRKYWEITKLNFPGKYISICSTFKDVLTGHFRWGKMLEYVRKWQTILDCHIREYGVGEEVLLTMFMI